jgi:hypothetical protein
VIKYRFRKNGLGYFIKVSKNKNSKGVEMMGEAI